MARTSDPKVEQKLKELIEQRKKKKEDFLSSSVDAVGNTVKYLNSDSFSNSLWVLFLWFILSLGGAFAFFFGLEKLSDWLKL